MGKAVDAGFPAAVPIDGAVGLGVDIVQVARMERVLARTPRFKERVFTEGERAYCESTTRPAVHYATRFAAKEAVLKALGTGFAHGRIAPVDVEVALNAKGRPQARLHRAAADVARELGVRSLPISLSFTSSDAVACAMAITDDSVQASEGRKDPMEELARRFKEARGMLDDLPVAGVGGGAATKGTPGADAQEGDLPAAEGATAQAGVAR